MPRVSASINCTVQGVDLKRMGKEISKFIEAATGSPCQVVVNERGSTVGRIQAWQYMSAQKRGNIAMRP